MFGVSLQFVHQDTIFVVKVDSLGLGMCVPSWFSYDRVK